MNKKGRQMREKCDHSVPSDPWKRVLELAVTIITAILTTITTTACAGY